MAVAAEPAQPPTKQQAARPEQRVFVALQQTAAALQSRSVEEAELPQFRELLAAAEALWRDETVPLDRRGKYCGWAKARLVDAVGLLRRQEAAKAQAARRPQTAEPRHTTLAQVAPLGTTPVTCPVWVAPVSSVARTINW